MYTEYMSTRRGFLKGLAAAVFTARGMETAQAQPLEKKERYSGLSDAIDTLAKKSDVIFLADTDHSDGSLWDTLFNNDVLTRAKAAGVRDLFLEISKAYQPEVDAFLQGPASSAKRFAFIEAVGKKSYEILKEDGIDLKDKAVLQQRLYERAFIAATADILIAAKRTAITPHLADPQPIADLYEMQTMNPLQKKEAITERIKKYDPYIAEHIKTASTGKAMVLYGSLHSMLRIDQNIDNILRDHGISTSSIFLTNKDGYAEKFVKDLQTKSVQSAPAYAGTGYDLPDVIYSPKRDRAVYVENPQTIIVDTNRRSRPAPEPAAFTP